MSNQRQPLTDTSYQVGTRRQIAATLAAALIQTKGISMTEEAVDLYKSIYDQLRGARPATD